MRYFPTVVVDDFFEAPELWVNLARSLEYAPDPQSRWPGTRSRPLHESAPAAYNTFAKSFFSIFYDLRSTDIDWRIKTQFQRVPPAFDAGWVHTDLNTISGVVYLTPDAGADMGTTICYPNQIWDHKHTDKKRLAFSGAISAHASTEYRDDNNSQFDDSIIVKNKFNRLVAFDAGQPHKATSFVTDGEDRLTLVFFIERIVTEALPRDRIVRRLW